MKPESLQYTSTRREFLENSRRLFTGLALAPHARKSSFLYSLFDHISAPAPQENVGRIFAGTGVMIDTSPVATYQLIHDFISRLPDGLRIEDLPSEVQRKIHDFAHHGEAMATVKRDILSRLMPDSEIGSIDFPILPLEKTITDPQVAFDGGGLSLSVKVDSQSCIDLVRGFINQRKTKTPLQVIGVSSQVGGRPTFTFENGQVNVQGGYHGSGISQLLIDMCGFAEAFPDQVSVISAGNNGEDLRPQFDLMNRSLTLLSVASWDSTRSRPMHNTMTQTYVDVTGNGINGTGSSEGAAIIEAYLQAIGAAYISQGIETTPEVLTHTLQQFSQDVDVAQMRNSRGYTANLYDDASFSALQGWMQKFYKH